MARETTKNAQNRLQIRQEYWPNATDWLYDPAEDKSIKGFANVTRLMPWITTLIRHLSKTGDPSSVYWEFWCRHLGQGVVEVRDEEECAFAAGYTSKRAVRTWHEHVEVLAAAQFIGVRSSGIRKVGYVLLPNPLAVARLHHEQSSVPDGWWVSFSSRARDLKAVIPPAIDASVFSVSPTKSPSSMIHG